MLQFSTHKGLERAEWKSSQYKAPGSNQDASRIRFTFNPYLKRPKQTRHMHQVYTCLA